MEIKITVIEKGKIDWILPQGVTHAQFADWKINNANLIAELRKHIGTKATIPYK